VKPPREEMQVWRVPELEGLELSRATYVTHSFGAHAHETLAIGVIDEGVGEFWCEGETHRAPTDGLALIAAGDVHTGGALGGASPLTYRMLYPSPALLRRFLREDAKEAPRFPRHAAYDAPLARRVRAVHQALQGPGAGLAEQVALLQVLEDVLVRYGRWSPGEGHAPWDVRLAGGLRDYLHAHLARRISLAELADVVQRHPAYLTRVFSRVMGLPPHAYLKQIRVGRARELLRSGRGPAEVARATGFAFKRLVGTTPARYRRDVLQVKNVQEGAERPA
jgi:AraC-like DNA-binding protein